VPPSSGAKYPQRLLFLALELVETQENLSLKFQLSNHLSKLFVSNRPSTCDPPSEKTVNFTIPRGKILLKNNSLFN
jgi:hypothetical protein